MMNIGPKQKHFLRISINLFVLVLSIYLLYLKVDFKNVIEQTKGISYYVFIITLTIALFKSWLMGLRWENLHPDPLGRLSKWAYFRLTMISQIFNLFLPGALGGDIVKTIYAVKEQNVKKTKNVIAVFVDRTVGLVSIFVFSVISLLIVGKRIDIKWEQLVFLFIVSGGFVIVLMNNKVLDYLDKLSQRIGYMYKQFSKVIQGWRESLIFYKTNSKTVYKSFLLCIPIHLISFISFYLLSKSVGIDISFLEIVFVISIMWLITALPISIGGIGVRELTLVWLMGKFGVPSEQAVMLSIMGYINGILIALIALPLLMDFRLIKPHSAEDKKII